MGLFDKLFGKKETRDGKAASPRQLAKWYREGLTYLDHCGPLDEVKFNKLNQITGGMLSEAQIRNFIIQSKMMLGGMGEVKNILRETLKKGISTFGSLGF